MSEEPVGMSDTGAQYAPMDINSGMDLPSGLKMGGIFPERLVRRWA